MSYCVKCRKNTENINPKMVKAKNGRLIIQSKCSFCGVKKQDTQGILNNLGIRTPLSKIPLLNVLF